MVFGQFVGRDRLSNTRFNAVRLGTTTYRVPVVGGIHPMAAVICSSDTDQAPHVLLVSQPDVIDLIRLEKLLSGAEAIKASNGPLCRS